MVSLTAKARHAGENRERRMAFATVDATGVPNAVWVLSARLLDDDKVVIANNAMSKTLANVETGGKASLLYIAPEREAYQLKGSVEHHREGPIYDYLKSWLNPSYPGRSAVLFKIEEIHYGATKVA